MDERDALVAKHVMGQKSGRVRNPYSSSMTSAWRVIGKLTERGLMVVGRAYGDKFGCEISPDGQHNNAKWFASGNRAPAVVCLAALRASGVEIE